MNTKPNHIETEKKNAAKNSVYAAIALTGMKLVVGLLTGSLGILAEAAHSGLDLVAAVVTYFAVRISDKPADSKHLYGHGKIENFSALIETILLLLTCAWIIYEAVHRLMKSNVEVEVTFWSFAVIIISIVVDISRSRMLYRVAKKHNSQALEADALHFSTDIWSSAVVLFGLVCVLIGKHFTSLAILKNADAAAALCVAIIVIYVSGELGMRAIHGLIDTSPEDMPEKINKIVNDIEGVKGCHRTRIRFSGAQAFVDIHVEFDGNQSLGEVHKITEDIEDAISKIIPNADVTVHPEPVELPQKANA